MTTSWRKAPLRTRGSYQPVSRPPNAWRRRRRSRARAATGRPAIGAAHRGNDGEEAGRWPRRPQGRRPPGTGRTVPGGRGSPPRQEPDRAQWRSRDGRGVRLAVPGLLDGLDGAVVADTGAAVALGVGVEDLSPAAAARQADAVLPVRAAGEVGHAGHRWPAGLSGVAAVLAVTSGGGAVAQERQHVARGV